MTDLTAEEVERRFPPITLIEDTMLRYDLSRALQSGVPEYFWEAPAASSYAHHNPYCCGQRGLWIHTLMVSTTYERLVDTWLQQDLISEFEADLGRAAVLVHDLRKYGDSYEEGEHADRDHDLQAARFVREETQINERVAEVVKVHMGPWYDGPAPQTDLDQLVHQADMVASSKNITPGVYQKPEEIAALYPALPEADL